MKCAMDTLQHVETLYCTYSILHVYPLYHCYEPGVGLCTVLTQVLKKKMNRLYCYYYHVSLDLLFSSKSESYRSTTKTMAGGWCYELRPTFGPFVFSSCSYVRVRVRTCCWEPYVLYVLWCKAWAEKSALENRGGERKRLFCERSPCVRVSSVEMATRTS